MSDEKRRQSLRILAKGLRDASERDEAITRLREMHETIMQGPRHQGEKPRWYQSDRPTIAMTADDLGEMLAAVRDAHLAISSYIAGLNYAARVGRGPEPDRIIVELRDRLRAIMNKWRPEP